MWCRGEGPPDHLARPGWGLGRTPRFLSLGVAGSGYSRVGSDVSWRESSRNHAQASGGCRTGESPAPSPSPTHVPKYLLKGLVGWTYGLGVKPSCWQAFTWLGCLFVWMGLWRGLYLSPSTFVVFLLDDFGEDEVGRCWSIMGALPTPWQNSSVKQFHNSAPTTAPHPQSPA